MNGKLGAAGDQGGHAIAHVFMHDQGSKNLFPQDASMNTSAFKKPENGDAAVIGSSGIAIKFEDSFSNFSGKRPQ